MCRLNADCAMCSASEAPLKLCRSATAVKYLSWRKSIVYLEKRSIEC
jgi:hypothetical protein